MDVDTKTPLYKTSDKTSFAFVSARDRWPVILTQTIDDVFRTTRSHNDPALIAAGKTLVEKLAKLKYELQHNRPITPLEDDGGSDIAAYNEELAQLGDLKWFDAPWLYAECYLYRRLRTFFANSQGEWKQYDPYRAQKRSTFKSSLVAVQELAARYKEIVEQIGKHDAPEIEKVVFIEMCEICLWGNATDLSLLTSLSYEDIQKLQGSEARKKAEKNVLVNDLPEVFEVLHKARAEGKETRRVDFVLDNAGFELYVDLVLAGYLIESGLATEVVLHPKDIPWFVSDVMPVDLQELLNALNDPVAFFSDEEGKIPEIQKDDLEFVFRHWSGLHSEGKIRLRPNPFWTLPGSYWRLPTGEKNLWEDLKESELVIFKGDLNYRKLTGDAAWAPSTPFAEAIGPLGQQGCGVRTLALRTCKADVVVGLPEGKDEELRGGDSERKWGWSGKWAVVQFWDGKK